MIKVILIDDLKVISEDVKLVFLLGEKALQFFKPGANTFGDGTNYFLFGFAVFLWF
jgi:hypothetical protein